MAELSRWGWDTDSFMAQKAGNIFFRALSGKNLPALDRNPLLWEAVEAAVSGGQMRSWRVGSEGSPEMIEVVLVFSPKENVRQGIILVFFHSILFPISSYEP